MKRYKTTGLITGACLGSVCWFFLGFMGLPQFLIYMSGIWMIDPVLRLLGLYGQISILFPALIVCLVSFAFYGWLLGVVTSVILKDSKR